MSSTRSSKKPVGVVLTGMVLALMLVVGASSASAQTFCVQASSRNLYLPVSGTGCQRGETVVNMATSSEVAALSARVTTLESKVTTLESANSELQSRLAGVSRSGDTLSFTGMNLQLKNGAGSTETANGLGNLIIGYDESPGEQTGSHNLMLGDFNSFTSYAGIVAGQHNQISGPFAGVFGGDFNRASGTLASITGGDSNAADGTFSSVSGGSGNVASGHFTSVMGGASNTADGPDSSIIGGADNTTNGPASSISGGVENHAVGDFASILGGADLILTGDEATYPAGP